MTERKNTAAQVVHSNATLTSIVGIFLIGAFFGTLGDYFHMISHTDGYLDPLFPLPTGQPFWVPFLFGFAILSVSLNHPLADHWADRYFQIKTPQTGSLPLILVGCLALFFLYVASGFLPLETGGSRDILLALGALAIWGIFDRTAKGFILALATAIIGTAVEIALTHFGAFYYLPSVANFWGVPTWLPWLYFAVSTTIGNLGRFAFRRIA
mgnify:CR=1 FL=1